MVNVGIKSHRIVFIDTPHALGLRSGRLMDWAFLGRAHQRGNSPNKTKQKMKFKSITSGKEKYLKNPFRFKIKWNGKCRSKFQSEVRKYLYNYWKYDSVYEEFPIIGTKLSLDFYNHTKKIAIEVQGAQHFKFVKHFHKTKANFLRQIRRDDKKWNFAN